MSPLPALHTIQTIAVFRALQVGDMLCAVPALRALRSGCPMARISLIGLPWVKDFVNRFDHYVDEFITFPGHPDLPEPHSNLNLLPKFFQAMKERQFDLALQMHGDGHISNGIVAGFGAKFTAGWKQAGDKVSLDHGVPYAAHDPEPVRLLALVGAIGLHASDPSLEFPLLDEDHAELEASGLATRLRPGAYLCMHPGARSREKCWPAECFAAVADALYETTGLRIVLTGSASEADLTAAVAARMHHPVVDTASPLSLGAMAALMNRARLLICNDTGVSHIAAGLRLPSVVIFHQADMERWAPLDSRRHRCLRDTEGRRIDEVLATALELLSKS